MGDSEQNKKAAVPEWQRPKAQEAAESQPSSTSDAAPVTIQQAKRFLQDDEVRKYPIEKKIEFLMGKGLEEDVVQRLLQEEADESASQVGFLSLNYLHLRTTVANYPLKPVEAEPQTLPTPAQTAPVEAEPQTLPTPAQPASVEAEPQTMPTPAQPSNQPSRPVEAKEDRPPIVTYPEFLTKPTRPPPLMTVNRFLNTLYAFGALSTLVYGTSKYIVAPMADNLTEARISLHDTAKDNLSQLVKKLEETVSEIPPSPVLRSEVTHEDGSASEYDDPTELFHRDIGVQTSLPPSPNPYGQYTSSLAAGREEAGETPSIRQARRLQDLVTSVREISNGFVSQSEEYENVKTVLGVFKDELDEMSYSVNDFVGASSLYGYGRSNEPDDEIKKAKENIRRVKGVLLSARSFPAGR